MKTNVEFMIDDIREDYNNLYERSLESISIDDKLIKDALKEQITLQLEWEMLHKKISNLYHIAESDVEESYNSAVSEELSDSYKKTTYSEAKSYAFANQEYKENKARLIEIQRIRDEVKGILDTVHSRKYILNNMSNLIVASMENHVI